MGRQDPSPVLTILGSGTLVPNGARHSSAHHLRLSGASLLLDCGPGALHGLAQHGVAWQDLTHIALSHFHNDHVGDLAAVLFALKNGLRAPRTEPLTLLGPVGMHAFLERLASALGSHCIDPGFELRVVELAPKRPFADPAAGFSLTCHPTPHTVESLAYRVAGPWGSLGYTGDTGPSEALAAFLAGCDVLIAECTNPDETAIDTHLSPTTLSALARVAGPELLLVVHVGPSQSPGEVVRRIRAGRQAPTVAGVDGLRVRLSEDGPAVDRHPGPV